MKDGHYPGILNEVAKVIAHCADVYGVRQHTDILFKIDLNELDMNSTDKFDDDGNTIYRTNEKHPQSPPDPIWTRICIRTEDIDNILEKIQNYSE